MAAGVTLPAGQETCSGTDADVFIQLTGSNGSFGPHQLPAGPEAFGTGCRDTFRLVTPSIGELQQVTISHNNMGFSPAWFLQRLELTNLDTGVKYVFQVAAWLDDAIGLSSTLWASQPPPIEPGDKCVVWQGQQGPSVDNVADALLLTSSIAGGILHCHRAACPN